MSVAGDNLTQKTLPTAGAVLTLGALVVRRLQEHGTVTLFVNNDGEVELALPGEVELDSLEEEEAISALLDRGYDDTQLVAYLKGRSARTQHRTTEKTDGKDL